MKKLLLLLIIIPFLSLSQTQIGQDIDGEVSGDQLGWISSLSSDGNILAVGLPFNDGNGSNSGKVKVYQNISGSWIQIGNDIVGEFSGDQSGRSLSLSSNGTILAIGAPFNDGNGSDSGHVRVFQNISGTWTQIGNDINGESSFNESGTSVSISSDGSILGIGAISNSGNGPGFRYGQVRVFQNLSGTWTQIGNDIDGENENDELGTSVSISLDGTILATGARFNDGNGDSSGHVRVYKNISGAWTQIGNDIDGEAGGDFSGTSVSLSGDGNILAIGASGNDAFGSSTINGGNGSNIGHVRVYENISDTWTQIGNDIDGEAQDDVSGFSTFLSSNGNILAVGGPQNDDNGNSSGHVRVYENISGIWTLVGNDINGESSNDQLGFNVCLSSNGSILAAGANFNDGNGSNSGHVRVFDLSAVLSIDEQTLINFNLYPNPVKTQFTIQLENGSELKNINIYNNLGQLVLTSKKAVINTSKLAVGLYIVEIQTNKGKGSKKLIIE